MGFLHNGHVSAEISVEYLIKAQAAQSGNHFALYVGADGHTARTRDNVRVQINMLPHFHMNHQLRLMHIYAHTRKRVQNPAAQLRVHLHGSLWISLAGTAGLYLEGFLTILAVAGL